MAPFRLFLLPSVHFLGTGEHPLPPTSRRRGGDPLGSKRLLWCRHTGPAATPLPHGQPRGAPAPDAVARWAPPLRALIDTGALITGLTNADVARHLLGAGLPDSEGVPRGAHTGFPLPLNSKG